MLEVRALYTAISRSMTGRYIVYAFNLASMMVLARIFSPEDYGTVAAIMIFMLFFQLLAEAGIGPAIINVDQLSVTDRDGLFGFTLVMGASLAFTFAFLAPALQNFYGIPRVSEVVPYIAVGIFFFAAGIVPHALLLREQAFYTTAIAGIVSELISTTAVITLSTVIDPLHALASKGLFSAASLFAVNWFYSAKTEFGRPLPGKHLLAIKSILNFSSFQFGFNFINLLSRNVDNVLVGKYMDAYVLGIYDKAYQLMKYPLMLLTYAMTPAIQPVIRKYANDRVKIEMIHRDFVFKLSILASMAGVAMYLLDEWIVLILLGEKWLGVVPVISILAMAIPVQVILSTSGSFFQAMNRADLLFYSGIISTIVMISAMIAGIASGDILVLCWYLVAAFHINFVISYYYLYKKVFLISMRRHFICMIPASSIVLILIVNKLLNSSRF